MSNLIKLENCRACDSFKTHNYILRTPITPSRVVVSKRVPIKLVAFGFVALTNDGGRSMVMLKPSLGFLLEFSLKFDMASVAKLLATE